MGGGEGTLGCGLLGLLALAEDLLGILRGLLGQHGILRTVRGAASAPFQRNGERGREVGEKWERGGEREVGWDGVAASKGGRA